MTTVGTHSKLPIDTTVIKDVKRKKLRKENENNQKHELWYTDSNQQELLKNHT